MKAAEQEWDSPSPIESNNARDTLRYLRGWASCIVKRSIGTRYCHHRYESDLSEYEGGLRDRSRLLAQVQSPLRQVLGGRTFRFGVMESFGRALLIDRDSLALESDIPGIMLRPAPEGDSHAPAHDLPIVFVDEYGIALTFDVFLALRLQGAGCTNSSLPRACGPPSTGSVIFAVATLAGTTRILRMVGSG